MAVQTLRLLLTSRRPCEAFLTPPPPSYFQASAPRRQRRPLLLHDPAVALPAGAQGLQDLLPVHRRRVGTVVPRGV